MLYKEIFKEDNENISERYELIVESIAEIANGERKAKRYAEYFKTMAEYLMFSADLLRQEEEGTLLKKSKEELKKDNEKIYYMQQVDTYDKSYLNPTYAKEYFKEDYYKAFTLLTAELQAVPVFAFEGRKMNMTLWMELFVEIETCFESDEEVASKEIKDIIYWFFHDYSEVFAKDRVRDMVDSDYDFLSGIVMDSDLSDSKYLYSYGEYISDNEIKISEFLNSLDESDIQSMADTMTEGFRIGYEHIGKDLGKKETVAVEFPIGFERIIRKVVTNFEKLGLKSTMFRNPVASFNRGNGGKRGVYTSSVNKQYEFDHRYDRAYYLDKAFAERRIEAMQSAYEEYKEKSKKHAGPAVMEIFGEVPFEPVANPDALKYDSKQNDVNVYSANRLGEITNRYIPGDERSFTIISYPVPAIGDKFEEIFKETVKINTLDYRLYQDMHQKLIDVLDKAKTVHVTGKGANRTDMYVQIHPLKNPDKESAFENCVADVNIPVGEVFTSPVLEGTKGKLNVSKVYLNGLMYLDLDIDFEDGKIVSYTCKNFDNEEENKDYVYNNVLMQHETLPIGEFAIGTNTTAYKVGRDYDIQDKYPILIAEKTGPHFAVGDTCYSRAEDTAVFNPDGKEIIARDNSVSILRKEDTSKAYFNCHTDITIPYDELMDIIAIGYDGKEYPIIHDGKFVVDGTEKLNEPLY
ncbi:MAG: aminopeptidase [Lachnospiraceae bacterium]|nr:aminopeptidase [Lachnospiraceae bacterium]